MINKLLVVGASKIIEQLFKISLMDSKIEISTASSCDEADKLISSKGPDVIFIDSSLKDQNAFDYARAVKLNNGKRVVLLKGSNDTWDKEDLNLSKADTVLNKPFEPDALMSILNSFNVSNPDLKNQKESFVSNISKTSNSTFKKTGSNLENRKSAISLLKKAELENAKKFISSNLVKKTKSITLKNSKPLLRDSFEKEGLAISEIEIEEKINKISTEIIQRVVWEVVPKLAEKIIKEEIKRLTEE